MKNFKTFLLLLLAIPFFISCEKDEPSTDKGESSEPETEIVKEYDGLLFDGILYYEVINSTYARVYCVDKDLCVGKIVIPHKIKFDKNVYSVTEIGEFAFQKCVGLDKIIIPNSVTYIGEEAFAGCCRLSRIACLATTPPTIYEDTFDEVSCPLYIPKDCISAYKAADYWNDFNDMFEWDEFLPEFGDEVGDIFVSDGLRYMVTKGAEEVAVIKLIDSSYSGEIIIPESVKFNGITYSVTSIGEYAFRDCSGLTSVVIGNSVTSIGAYAFYNCKGLTSIEIPNSVTSIGSFAFYNCSGLTSVTIGNSVTSIGEWAFFNCSGLTNVYINDLEAYCNIEFANEDANPVYYAKNLYLNGSLIEDLVIPEGVTKISDYLFYGLEHIKSVTIPNSVTSIGDKAFYGCSGLTNVYINDLEAYCNIEFANSSANPVYYAKNLYLNGSLIEDLVIPKGVTKISDYLFYGLEHIKTVTIPNSVTSIGERAFHNCSGLTSVTIGNSVTSIGDGAFYGCSGLTSVTIGNSVTSIGKWAFYGCSGLTSVVWNAIKCNDFPDNEYHENGPFYNCKKNITSFTIGDAVQHIPAYLCKDMFKLTSIEIPNSVTSIGSGAFDGCSGLTSIEIPNSVTSIDYKVFSDCSGLTSIEIPNSVTSIGTWAFRNCSGLTSIEIPNSVTSIGDSAFRNCSGLTSVTIGNSVTSIGAGAFYYCDGLTSIEIPNSVTSIGVGAFSYCTGLTSLTIGKSVTSIDDDAFNNCNAIKIIDCKTTKAPACGEIYTPFESEVYRSANLYVPIGSKNSYKNSEGWSQFRNIIEKDFSEN